MNKIFLVRFFSILLLVLSISACDKSSKPTTDTTPPVITLKGSNPAMVTQGNNYNDPGASAVDEVDGTVTISVSGTVDTSKVGKYTLTYSATDKAGNTGKATRTVNVIADTPDDTTPPVITLKGDNPATVTQGNSYSDPGASAMDGVDGTVTVSVSGTVDTGTVGSYTLTYSATDKADNTAKVTRTVNVIADTPENNPPTITSDAIVDAQVNINYQYGVVGEDPDQDTLSYTLTTAPEGMTIDAATGFIQWTPTIKQEGVQSVVVEVSDTGGLKATQTFDITVAGAPDELSAVIIANPATGTSPLTVRFSSDIQNNNIVITGYAWDFDGDDTTDRSDNFGAPQTYTYTGNPGDTFEVTLTATVSGGDPLVATKTITLTNQPPTVQVAINTTNGHAPLAVSFIVTAQDPQGIAEISVDFDGDGTVDSTQEGDGDTSGSWTFPTTYQDQGSYVAVVRVTDTAGAETQVTNNAITVDVNDPLDPIIQLSATPASGTAPLLTSLSASVELFDGSTIQQWRWDLEGDGVFETQGGTEANEIVNPTYTSINNFYPVVEVETSSGRIARSSLRIETLPLTLPLLNIPNNSDTINSDVGESANFTVNTSFETELEVWLENADGVRVRTLQVPTFTTAGDHNFAWDATNDQNEVVSEGDYYVVLGYTAFDQPQEVDLRTTTGGRLSYYRRTTANPRTFDRVKEPLRINYAVDEPAEVSFFWQISFGARLMTLLEREPSGRGQYSLYWNGAFPNGQKIPDNLQTLMPGIVRYALSDNVIFVKETPRIENFTLKSTVLWDPRREPIGLNLKLSKPSTIELVVADMDKGVDVATRVFSDIAAGEQQLTWDGKNDDDQYLAPGDYRIGVRSVDSRGTRSLYWFRTQRINY